MSDSENDLFTQCEHKTNIIVRRIYSNGVLNFQYQCTKCGRVRTIKKSSLTAEQQLNAPEYDPDINDRYYHARNEAWQSKRDAEDAEKQKKDREWWIKYNIYLESDRWKKKRQRVLDRALHICEGCGRNGAVHVHHENYSRVGNEMLWDLRAVCKDCHSRLHPNKNEGRR